MSRVIVRWLVCDSCGERAKADFASASWTVSSRPNPSARTMDRVFTPVVRADYCPACTGLHAYQAAEKKKRMATERAAWLVERKADLALRASQHAAWLARQESS